METIVNAKSFRVGYQIGRAFGIARRYWFDIPVALARSAINHLRTNHYARRISRQDSQAHTARTARIKANEWRPRMSTKTLEDITKPVFSQKNDRCDRCNAPAIVRAEKNQQELLFCGHHGSKHEDALTTDGWTIERAALDD